MGIIIATATFVLAGMAISMVRRDPAPAQHIDGPARSPRPGTRDLHSITGTTLASAPVPSWT